MGQVVLSLPADGQTIDASDVNNPLNTLANEFNGNIDNTNIKTNANISGTKLAAGTLPASALDATSAQGWVPTTTFSSVVNNGNRSYTCVVAATDLSSVLAAGMRIRSNRTVAAPTQSTNLNGSNQSWSKTSPNGMTFTTAFTASAWIKIPLYAAGVIESRYNGTSGWVFRITASGQVEAYGFNAGAGNYRGIQSYQSIPLNKWVHVAIVFDMSTGNGSIVIDGTIVPALGANGGTSPTTLIQAGNYEVGTQNGITFFTGKLAQVAIFSAALSLATIQSYLSQTLTGSETALISAYDFNGTGTDKNTTNANNLTANGAATATTADSPFGGQSSGLISANFDYGIIQSVIFSTNTTIVVQVAEGCTIPTSGGVANVVYSPHKAPYGFPAQRSKWRINTLLITPVSTSGTVAATVYNPAGLNLTVPIGEWLMSNELIWLVTSSGAFTDVITSISTSSTVQNIYELTARTTVSQVTNSNSHLGTHVRSHNISVAAATPYYILIRSATAFSSLQLFGETNTTECCQLTAENAYL